MVPAPVLVPPREPPARERGASPPSPRAVVRRGDQYVPRVTEPPAAPEVSEQVSIGGET